MKGQKLVEEKEKEEKKGKGGNGERGKGKGGKIIISTAQKSNSYPTCHYPAESPTNRSPLKPIRAKTLKPKVPQLPHLSLPHLMHSRSRLKRKRISRIIIITDNHMCKAIPGRESFGKGGDVRGHELSALSDPDPREA